MMHSFSIVEQSNPHRGISSAAGYLHSVTMYQVLAVFILHHVHVCAPNTDLFQPCRINNAPLHMLPMLCHDAGQLIMAVAP